MTTGLTGERVIMVTGASTGFGRLISETAARHGYRVFATMRNLTGRNEANARTLQEMAERESLSLQPLELDVTDDESVERAVGKVISQTGRIDVLVNNAGYGLLGVTEAATLEQAQRIMDTNFFGVVRMNRAVLPHMRKQKDGLLVHISSGAGRIVVPGMAFYCASKWALEALAEEYRYQLASQGIDSVIVEPGAYRTSVFSNVERTADTARTNTYGFVVGISDRVLALLSSSNADPQEVADAVLQIIETPFGHRKLRHRVARGLQGIVELNELSERVQKQVIADFGLEAELEDVHGQSSIPG